MCGGARHTCTLMVLEGSSRKQDPSRMLQASATCRRAAQLSFTVGAQSMYTCTKYVYERYVCLTMEHYVCLVIWVRTVCSFPQEQASNAARQPRWSTPNTEHQPAPCASCTDH